MAALIAREKIIVGVTGDVMLAKKSNAHLLEPLEERIAAVKQFITTLRSTMPPLKQDVVELADVCGPAGSEADLQALLVTEETIAGADTIAKVRSERELPPLERYVIGVLGAGGETDVKGDAAELAAAKVGSTAIRKWLAERPPALQARARRRNKVRYGLASPSGSGDATDRPRPMAASVPALGLSNRAVFEGQAQQPEVNELGRTLPAQSDAPVSGSAFTRPPVEEELLVSTLWPELDKLYGHGYELHAIDASPDDSGRLVATSCKSTTPEHAVVRVYDRLDNWREVGVLAGHSLTITRIRFSPNGKWVLTVSRDRSWRLHRRNISQGSGVSLFPVVHKDAAHARIIWDAAWADDSRTFATASRDKSVKVWRLSPGATALSASKDTAPQADANEAFSLVASVSRLAEPATAVAFDVADRLAVGLDNGDVLVYQLEGAAEGSGMVLRLIVSLKRHHTAAVNELAWKPPSAEAEEDESADAGTGEGLLLSAGDDGAVRLVRIE